MTTTRSSSTPTWTPSSTNSRNCSAICVLPLKTSCRSILKLTSPSSLTDSSRTMLLDSKSSLTIRISISWPYQQLKRGLKTISLSLRSSPKTLRSVKMCRFSRNRSFLRNSRLKPMDRLKWSVQNLKSSTRTIQTLRNTSRFPNNWVLLQSLDANWENLSKRR